MTATDRPYCAFLSLLRRSLWDTPLEEGLFPLSEDEWEALHAFAVRQAVSAVVFDSVSKMPREIAPSTALLARWVLSVQRQEDISVAMEAAVRVQAGWWREAGITAVQLKGQSIAAFYPCPQHRMCGDIDWYFPTEGDWDAALELVRSKSLATEKDSDGDVHYVWEGIVVEHHRRWDHLSSARSRRYLREMEADYDMVGEANVLPAELNLLMINVHILKHAMVLGVGFRQVCDLAVMCRALHDVVDAGRYRDMITRTGLEKWTEMMHSVLVDVLSMPEEYLPYPLENHRDIARFTDLVMRDGNLGMHRDGDGYQGRGRLGRLAYMAGGYMDRAGLFLRYAPGEFISRGWNLLAGRLSR